MLLNSKRGCTFVLLCSLVAACDGKATAGPVSASPETIAARLRQARGGDTITLAPGDYGTVTVPRGAYSPALRIVADKARFTSIVIGKANGVTISGGTLIGSGGRSYGVSVRDSQNIRIERMKISGAHRGIVINESSDVALVGNELTGLISDGIDIALSRRILVKGNSCRDFNPTPPVFDANGVRLRDGDHPDCIQAWSRPTAPPTADLVIEDNTIEGAMQGIFLGNHVRNGVDDGGFDRVVIRNNRIRVGYPHGLTIGGGRDVTITGNIVDTIDGARLAGRPDRAARANLNIVESVGVTACDNRVSAVPRAPGQSRCKGQR